MVSTYTVVIPAYNAAAFVGECLSSVLAQSIPPDRIIVVDDGSSDDTAGAVRAIAGPIDYVRQDNSGPGGATTRGFAMVTTPWIATNDADDVWLPNKIERQFDELARQSDLDGVFCQMVDFQGSTDSANYNRPYDAWTRSTMLIRTDVALAAGPLVDEASRLGDMIDWMARVRERGNRLIMLREVLALRRQHEGNLSKRSREERSKGYMATVRAAMLRRREGGGA